MYKSILDYLCRAEKSDPNKIALVDPNEQCTYCQLNTMAKRIASAVLEKIQEINVPVIVLMNKSVKTIAAFMGVAYTRNFYVPLDINMPAKRLNTVMKSLGSKVIITDNKNYDYVVSVAEKETEIIRVEELEETPINKEVDKRYEQAVDTDPLYAIYTSGSTGVPKGVIINHRAVINFVEEARNTLSFDSDDRFLNQAPFHFDASLPDIYCCIGAGATLHMLSKNTFYNPLKVVKYMEQNEISIVFWVPSVLVLIANAKVLQYVNLNSLKKVAFCGEVLPVKQYNIWKEKLPNAIFVNYYGPTETTYACSHYLINREFQNTDNLPIGFANQNAEIILLNSKNELAKDGEVGELCVKGFVQNPLIDTYRDIIYRTGDLARYNEYGELEYVGRWDSQIKFNGYRIELGEVECALMSIEEIDCACCLFDENKQMLYAFYVADNISDLDTRLSEYLPEYMMPSRYIKLEHMIYNSNGKIDRKGLKEKYIEND